MAPEIWIGIAGTLFLGAFIINGMRASRGPEGHAANAGRLHMVVGGIALPFMWMAVLAAAGMWPARRATPMQKYRTIAVTLLALALSACASQIDAGVSATADTPGFLWGLWHGFWHGFIFPWSFIGSLFDTDIAVYSVPNKGGWYDFGFFLGITVLGGGSVFGSKKRGG